MTRVISIVVGTWAAVGLTSCHPAQSPPPPAATAKAHESSALPCRSPACQPLMIIDGIRLDSVARAGGDTSGRFRGIKPEEIVSITVMRGPEAIRRYGDAAKNGVIFVKTKRARKTVTDSASVQPAPPASKP